MELWTIIDYSLYELWHKYSDFIAIIQSAAWYHHYSQIEIKKVKK